MNLRYTFRDAASHRVTVLAASGDSGATNDQPDGATLYPYRAISWPSSDPLVTSVGGTQLLLAQDGNKIRPDRCGATRTARAAAGSPASSPAPGIGDRVASVVGDRRGTPDILMSAAVTGGCWVYQSFDPSGPGWEILGGTSRPPPSSPVSWRWPTSWPGIVSAISIRRSTPSARSARSRMTRSRPGSST